MDLAGTPLTLMAPFRSSRSSMAASSSSAASSNNCWRASMAAISTAAPTVKMILLPPEEPAYGALSESKRATETASVDVPRISAAIMARLVSVPEMSTDPTWSVIEPSASIRHPAAAGSEPLDQPPTATPRPSPAASGLVYIGCERATARHCVKPMRSQGRPSGRRSPFCVAF